VGGCWGKGRPTKGIAFKEGIGVFTEAQDLLVDVEETGLELRTLGSPQERFAEAIEPWDNVLNGLEGFGKLLKAAQITDRGLWTHQAVETGALASLLRERRRKVQRLGVRGMFLVKYLTSSRKDRDPHTITN